MRLFVLCALLFAPIASADVILVGGPDGAFSEIEAALAATTGDDLLLIRPGDYAPFEIVDRSATLIASGDMFEVRGRVRVRDLSSDRQVFISGMVVIPVLASTPGDVDSGIGLTVRDCLGAVRVRNSTIFGNSSSDHPSISIPYPGIQVENSGNVALTDSLSFGGQADVGLLLSGSNITTFNCTIGSVGAMGCAPGGGGVRQLGDVHLFDSGSQIFGSSGTTDICGGPLYGWIGTDGGDAIQAFSAPPQSAVAPSTNLHDTLLLPGNGGQGNCFYDGVPYGCDGQDGVPHRGIFPNFVVGTRRAATIPERVTEGSYLQIELSGAVGDQAVLVLSNESDFLPSPARYGVQLAGAAVPSATDRVIALGTLPSTDWSVPVAIPLEDASFSGQTWFAQVVFVDAQGETWYGPGSFVAVLDDEQLDANAYFCFAGEVEGSSCGVCPCSNIISPGNWGGCRNGNGTSCRLVASGEASLSNDTLSFSVTGAGTDTAALLNSADNRLPAMGACPIGSGIGTGSGMDGLRCIGGALLRHGVRGVDVDGTSVNPWGFGSPNPPGGILASASFAVGQTRHFQVFYRDNFQAGCGTALNTSNGVSVTVSP